MRFRRKKTNNQHNRPERQLIRKYIWKNPSIIEDLFPDHEWQSHEKDAHQVAPSTKMAQHIHDEINKETQQQENKSNNKRHLKQFTYYAAASVLLLLSLGIWLWIKPAPYTAMPILVQQHEEADSKQDTTWISLTNKKTSTQTHTLPDRSTVRLFAQSTIRYPQHFTDHNREIYLDGKAYFSVKKDPSRPFSVYASGTKTTALGTSFTIDTRSRSTYTSVQLHTGKVVVAAVAALPTFKNIILKNIGESLSFDANMQIIAHQMGTVKKEAKTSTPMENKQNRSLVQLNNIPLPEVFVTLQATYDIAIKIDDQEISKIQYTGSIDPQRETIQDVLAVICLINNLRYVQESDGSFTIYHQNEDVDNQLTNP